MSGEMEIAERDDSAAEIQRLIPGQLGRFDENRHDWNSLQAEAIGLGGAELLEGKEGDGKVDYLVKVPHTIVSVAFYQGKKMLNGHQGAFAAAKAMIAPEDILAKRFRGNDKARDYTDLPFYPEDIVVYNDGSTGFYRQIVRALHDHGFIALPDPVIEGGPAGESTYDLHPSEWTGFDKSRCRILPAKEDGSWGGVEFDIRISAPRGIRYSEYDGPEGKARTRYIA